MKEQKKYTEDCLGFRISIGIQANRMIKGCIKDNIEMLKSKYIGKLKSAYLNVLGKAYLKTGKEIFLSYIIDEMKPYHNYYTKLFNLQGVLKEDIKQAINIGIYDGLIKYNKKLGFIFNSIQVGIKRELSKLEYENQRYYRHINIENDISEMYEIHDVIRNNLRTELFKIVEKSKNSIYLERLISGDKKLSQELPRWKVTCLYKELKQLIFNNQNIISEYI